MLRALFTIAFSLAAGILLAAAARPVERPPAPPPHAGSILDLACRFHVRPVLRGEPERGNAGDWYRKASSQLLCGGEVGLLEVFEDEGEPGNDEARVWVWSNREALASMRRGTTRAGCILPIDPFRGSEADAPEVGLGPQLASIAAGEAHFLRKDGRTPEASRVLLDAARFGQDLARGGGVVHRLYADRVEFLALRRLLALLAGGVLPAGLLRDLAAETDRLLAGVHPPVETLGREAALRLADLDAARRPRGASASAAAGILAWLERAGAAARGAEGGPCEAFAAAERAAREGGWDPVAGPLPDLSTLERVERRTETLRRAVRVALALQILRKAAGAFPAGLEDLDSVPAAARTDPFSGAPFVYRSESPDSAVLVSVGPDGKDDGGAGGPVTLREGVRGDWVFALRGGR